MHVCAARDDRQRNPSRVYHQAPLAPFFPRSAGFGPTHFLPRGALPIAPSIDCHCQSMPSISSYSASPACPIRKKNPAWCRWLKILVYRTGQAKLLWQCLTLAAGAQHINDGGKNLPRILCLAAHSGLALILLVLTPNGRWNQRADLSPQCVGNCPRLDGWHTSTIIIQGKLL